MRMASLKGSITVFPTQVGVIPSLTVTPNRNSGIPHASGGDPERKKYEKEETQYSPRKWG